MGNRLLLSLATIAMPTAMSWAVELQPMTLEPSQPPQPATTSDHLVDAVIPAYGVRDRSPYRLSSRMNTLYRQVQLFTGHVDALVLSNTLATPDDSWDFLPEEQFPAAARPRLVKAQLLPQQEQLVALLAEVMRFEETTPLPNRYERWHINNSYRDIYRSAEHLALAIGDMRFTALRDLHRAWKDYYHRLAQAQVVEIMASMVETEPIDDKGKMPPPPNLDKLLEITVTKVTPIPWPSMSLDIEANPYPAIYLPSIPRWSELKEDMQQRFIERFGVPGQAMAPFFPQTVVPEVEESGESDTPAVEEETVVEEGAEVKPIEEEAEAPEVEVEIEAAVIEASEPEVSIPVEEAPAEEEIPIDDLEIEIDDLEIELE